MRYLALIFAFTLLAGAPKTLLAVEGQPCGVEGEPPCKIELPNPLGTTTTFAQLLDKIITFLLQIGTPIASIMVIWGAFQILFAGGEPEKFLVGRRTILYTVIAYGILLVAKGITLIIGDLLK